MSRRGAKALARRLLADHIPNGGTRKSGAHGSGSAALLLEHRSAAAATAASGEWRRFSSSGAGRADPPAAAAPWSLKQRAGGTIVTASSSGDGGVQLQRCYTGRLSGGGAAAQAAAPRLSLSRLRQEGLSQLQATFLPSGYPATVAPGYLRNTLWQAAHHCAGSANGVLASTFLLYAVGLGAGAVPTAGALNWVLKDGLGQLGTLLFGKTIAHRFDVSSRAWYLLASAKLNAAMGLEICTMLLPQYFLPIGALANAIKGLSWMAGGSTKSVFKVSFAADNNFGDVSAKATSQTIFSSVLGTAVGVTLASQIGQSVGLALTAYTGLAALHMWTGYQAVRCVPLATLNPSRLELLVQRYLEQQQQQQQQQEHGEDEAQQQQQPRSSSSSSALPGHAAPAAAAEGSAGEGGAGHGSSGSGPRVQLPTPPELAPADTIFHRPWVCVGTPLTKLVDLHGGHLGELLQQQLGQEAGAAAAAAGARGAEQQQGPRQQRQQLGGGAAGQVPPVQRHMLVPAGRHMHLLLHEQASAADCILGFLHAFVLQHGTSGSMSSAALRCGSRAGGGGHVAATADGSLGTDNSAAAGSPAAGGSAEALRRSLAEARRLLPGFLSALEAAGWDDEKVVLEAKRRRVTW